MKSRGRSAKNDALQKKARRQKQILIGGAVVLLLLGAFEVPKVMKHGKTAASVSTTGTTPVLPAASTPGEPSAQPISATPAAGPVSLPSESGPTAGDGQLVTFSLLKSKDPFKQQLTETTSSAGTGTTPASTPPTGTTSTPPVSTTPVSTPPVSTPPAGTTPAGTTPAETTPAETGPTPTAPTETTPPSTTPPQTSTTKSSTAPPPKPVSAKISVNGAAEDVTIGASFPKAQPLFTLVSVEDGVARVGIAGGTLQGSTQTVPLVEGKTLTLMNTADGTRYVLKLVSVAYVAG